MHNIISRIDMLIKYHMILIMWIVTVDFLAKRVSGFESYYYPFGYHLSEMMAGLSGQNLNVVYKCRYYICPENKNPLTVDGQGILVIF